MVLAAAEELEHLPGMVAIAGLPRIWPQHSATVSQPMTMPRQRGGPHRPPFAGQAGDQFGRRLAGANATLGRFVRRDHVEA